MTKVSAARDAFERQAGALRMLVGASIDELAVGDAAVTKQKRGLQ